MSSESLRDAVRQLIWDQPVRVLGEMPGIGDGRRTVYELAGHPVMEGSLLVLLDGADVTDTVEVDLIHGLVSFPVAPDEGAVLLADYAWARLSDAAIDSQLAAAGESVPLAAARCLEVLQLDPSVVLALRMPGIGTDLMARQAAIASAIKTLRGYGSYAQFQHRVDRLEWQES